MTLHQLILIICSYLIVLMAVIYFTKPTLRRLGGALIGGAVGGGLFLTLFNLGRVYGFWRASLPLKQGLLILFYIGTAISLTPFYLVTWRVSRRFGYRGLTVFLGVVALIAPPRDYLIASKHPEWIVFSPGVAPIFADSATYVGIILLGHAVMRFVAGSSREDRLVKRLFNII
jgi:hypothetical protein